MKNPAKSPHFVPDIRRMAHLSRGEKRKLSLIGGLSIILVILSLARAAQSAVPPVDHKFVKSAFVKTPGFGKDPFFPKSTRLGAVPTAAIVEAGPASITSLTLKGISGPKTHRLAIINNRTFEPGEEADIRVMGQTFHIKMVEIRDDGVVIAVNGQTHKLSLGPKL